VADRYQALDAGSFEALLENAKLLVSARDLPQLLSSLLRSVMGRLAVSRGLLSLVEQDREVVAISRGFKALPAATAFTAEAAREAGAEHLFAIGPEAQPIGHLALGKPLMGELGARERELLEALLGIAASAIQSTLAHEESRRLNRQLDRRVHQLGTLLDLARNLTSSLDPEQVAQVLGLTLAGQWLLRRYAVVAVKAGHGVTLRHRRMALVDEAKPAHGAELVAAAQAVTEPTQVDELEEGPLRQALVRVEASLVVPLRSGEKAVGFAALGERPGGQPFAAEDLDFCAGLAGQAVVALENAWYFAETLEQRKLERDLALAGEIQQRLFPPSLPQPAGFQLAARNRPASQVGGDYFDALEVPAAMGGGLLLCVADVSGKGIAASLLMSNIQATLRALLHATPGLEELVGQTSRLVHGTTPTNKYATAIFALLDPRTGACRAVNAGHNEGLLVRADGTIEEVAAGGLPVGLMAVGGYRPQDLRLEAGDLLAFYSDGVNEANDAGEEEWGRENLKESLLAARHESAEAVVDRVFAAVDAFAAGAPQYDDITLLVLKRYSSVLV
jgi:sigma-B regulation protein RsbU (phosphoserine phosphatase)